MVKKKTTNLHQRKLLLNDEANNTIQLPRDSITVPAVFFFLVFVTLCVSLLNLLSEAF